MSQEQKQFKYASLKMDEICDGCHKKLTNIFPKENMDIDEKVEWLKKEGPLCPYCCEPIMYQFTLNKGEGYIKDVIAK